MAEFERALIHQRTSSGRVAARVRGVHFGRPPKLTPEQIALGRRLVDEGTSFGVPKGLHEPVRDKYQTRAR
jgi:DNA invertase Pin-like site-specific DNA recombinase